jgi:uncharacterized protein
MVSEAAWLLAPLRRGPELFVGQCRDVRFAHNPLGEKAILPLCPRSSELLAVADGRSAQATIEALAGPAQRAREPYLEALSALLAGGYLRSPAVEPTSPPAPPERFFNTWVHITNHCNLDCPYCYVAKTHDHMSDEVLARILGSIEATAKAKAVDHVHLRFAGGEPMLRFSALTHFFEEAKRRCAPHAVRLTGAIITNGSFIPGEALSWLAQEQLSISLSIDGVGEFQDVMRPVRGGGPSFRLVEESIDRYLAAGIRPYALVTVSRGNLSGLLELTKFLLAKELGFRLSLIRDFQQGHADLDEQVGVDLAQRRRQADGAVLLQKEVAEELIGVLHQVYDAIEAHVAERPSMVPSFSESHRFCDLELWKPIKRACGAAETYVAIGDKGQFSACQGALHFPGTQALDPELTLIQNAAQQTQLLPFTREAANEECRACRHRHSCAGGCPLLLHRRDGHVDGRSPYCEVFREVIPRILGIAALEKQRGS